MKWSLHKKILSKTIALALAIAFVAPSVFAVLPVKEVKAASTTTCAASFISAIGEAFTEQTAGAVTSVPTADSGKSPSVAEQRAADRASYIKECIEKPLAYALAKMILDQITNSLVTWINGGFNGSPSFVTDPGKFFLNIADQFAGEMILGSDLAFLCSPFKIQVQLALALNYNASNGNAYAQTAACTLSDVFNNVDNAFSDFAEGGWAGWFKITQASNNNAFGSFLDAASHLSVGINDKQAKAGAKLNWGDGFLPFETCKNLTTGEEKSGFGGVNGSAFVSSGNQTASANNSNNNVECHSTTPGHTISAALDKQLGVDTDRLGVAQDLDQIFAALTGQLMKQVFGAAQGLLGASDPNNSSGTSKLSASSIGYSTSLEDKINQQKNDSLNAGKDTTNPTQPGIAPTNIAVNKKVLASSISQSYEPGYITDGNNKSSYGNGDFSGAITNTEDNPWLQVDLGVQTIGISHVDVYQRIKSTNATTGFLRFVVQILDKDQNIVWTSPSYEQNFSGVIEVDVKDLITGKSVDGRYVKLQGTNRGRFETAEVEIFQNQPPTITLKGGSTINITKGGTFTDPGYSALDNQDGDLTAQVQSTGTVDTTIPGNYKITYTVTDMGGATATVVRNITVSEPYVITP